jgi:hypothetical protein
VIGALIEVHRHLGPGLMESAYEACVCAELSERGLKFERQRPLPIVYKGVHRDCGYRLDLPVGLLVNFNTVVLRNGLRRLTPDHPKSSRSPALPVQSK